MVNNHPKYVAMTDSRQFLIQNIIVMIPSAEYSIFPINFMVQKASSTSSLKINFNQNNLFRKSKY